MIKYFKQLKKLEVIDYCFDEISNACKSIIEKSNIEFLELIGYGADSFVCKVVYKNNLQIAKISCSRKNYFNYLKFSKLKRKINSNHFLNILDHKIVKIKNKCFYILIVEELNHNFCDNEFVDFANNIESKYYEKYCSVYSFIKELKKYNIECKDLNENNLMFREDGTVVFSDVGNFKFKRKIK